MDPTKTTTEGAAAPAAVVDAVADTVKAGREPKKARAKATPKKKAAKQAKPTKARAKPQSPAPKPGEVIKTKQPRSADFQRVKRVGTKKYDLTGYTAVVAASGNSSLDCGDDVATRLRGKDLDEVYRVASEILREPMAALRRKYEHLNPGMQRMNLGNRIRGAMAEDADESDDE